MAATGGVAASEVGVASVGETVEVMEVAAAAEEVMEVATRWEEGLSRSILNINLTF